MVTLQAPPPTKHEIIGTMADIIRTVDEHARALNKRWGFNRLPHLVPIDWTEKFRRQKAHWQTACFECTGSVLPADLDRVRKHGSAMLRAFEALERVAVENGHVPELPRCLEFELKDGTPVILVQDRADLDRVDAGGRTVQIWALDEIADVIAKFPMLADAKTAFPGAELVQLKTSSKVHDALNDELADMPF